MKAIRVHQFGNPEAIKLDETPDLDFSPGQVVVRVYAAGVNPADWYVVNGLFQIPAVLPFTPGFEAAGEIVAVHESVTNLKPGTRVLVTLPYVIDNTAQFGAFAEQLQIPAANVVPLPDGMDFITAAAIPVIYGTAYISLNRAQLQPKEMLLVTGGTGGTGSAAIQIGKLLGAKVIATTSSPEKLQKVKELGADYAIDYKQENVAARTMEITEGKGVDVAFETVGGDLFEAVVESMAWEGRLLPIGAASGKIPEVSIMKPLAGNFSIVGTDFAGYAVRRIDLVRKVLAEILDWHQSGKLQAINLQTMPLTKAAEAIELVHSGKAGGKVVLTM
jgi:NADPH:quinone reductase